MKKLATLTLFVLFALLDSIGKVSAADYQGFPRVVHVEVETRDKKALMDLVQDTFESDGYRLHRRSDVEIIMARPLPASLEWELRSAKGKYWNREYPVLYGASKSEERLCLSVIRSSVGKIAIDGYRLLVMSPNTTHEGGVADENAERAETLRRQLQIIEAESKS